MVADDLRRQADQFIDLADLRNELGRDPGERRERAPAPVHADDDDYADDV
jgi:uncharacterized LabA/DUF88 family protein